MWFLPFLSLLDDRDTEKYVNNLNSDLHYGRTEGVWYLDKPDHVHPLVTIFDRPVQPRTYRESCFVVGGTLASGLFLGGFANKLRGLPLKSRPIVYVIGVTSMVCGVYVLDDWMLKRELRRRVFFKNYVLRHPELFPERERPKYKDMLLPWFPAR